MIHLGIDGSRPESDREPFKTTSANRVVVATAALLAVMATASFGMPWGWAIVAMAAFTAAVVTLPRLSLPAMPIITYASIWVGFNVLRARGDGTPWADPTLGLIPDLEARIFGGTLPSAILQDRYFALPLEWPEYVWAAVYLSFFMVPHLVAVLLLWRCRPQFWHYLVALAFLFALALVGFYAIPTAPPWLVTEVVPEKDFAHIVRVASVIASQLDLPVELYHRGLRGSVVVSQVRIEPNPMAAMPSIHFAATALLIFPALRLHRGLGLIALAYTLLMGVALVYLGEHYILDLVVGGLFVAIAWIAAGRLLARLQPLPYP